MRQIAYLSTASCIMDVPQLEELLGQCRQNNKSLEVTGLLLFYKGNFLQVLEGPEHAVLSLYEKITQDPRHKFCIQVVNRDIEERGFGEWQMGFVHLDSRMAESLPGYYDFFNQPITQQTVTKHKDEIFDLLVQFKQIHLAGKE